MFKQRALFSLMEMDVSIVRDDLMQRAAITIALQQTSIAEDIQFIIGPGGDSEGRFFCEGVRLGRKDGECIQSLSCRLRQPLIGDSDDGLE